MMRLRLSYRINLYIACILVTGAAVLTFHDYIFREMVLEETGIKEAERLSKVVFGELYHAMQTSERRESNRDVIERFKKVSSVKDIKIIHGPAIDAQFGTEEDETASDEDERRAIGGVAVAMEEAGFIRYIMPVFIKEECRRCHVAKEGEVAGAVAVTLSTSRFHEIATLKTKYFIALNALILLLTASAIFYILRVRIISPLGRLKKGADAISSGDLNHRVAIKSGDELEDVGSAFDRMASSLSATTGGLMELNEKYSKLIENSPNAIVLYDAQTKKISDVNSMAEAVTGYARAELLSMRPDDMHLPENLARYEAFRERWILDGKGYFFETQVKKKDGSLAWVDISAAVMDLGGKPFVQEIWKDLSERRTFANALRDYAEGLEKKVKERTAELNSSLETLEKYKNELEKAYAKLKDSEKGLVESAKLASLGEMGAGIAHELNSPLAGILSITEVLINRSAENDPNKRLLEKMKDAAVRSKDIISDMLTYARPAASLMSETAINDVVKSTLSLFTSELKKISIEIREDYSKSLPLITGNKGQLMSVFLNILKNARDAIGEKGAITIKTGVERAYGYGIDAVVVEISDTGSGIPFEARDMVFDPFFTTKEKGGGLNIGLGLSIAKSIVTLHNGSIGFVSEPGKGTTFKVSFPAFKNQSLE